MLTYADVYLTYADVRILGSEDFKTNPDKYLTLDCLMRSIVDMEGDFVKETFRCSQRMLTYADVC
jgi:hypothetical protein